MKNEQPDFSFGALLIIVIVFAFCVWAGFRLNYLREGKQPPVHPSDITVKGF